MYKIIVFILVICYSTLNAFNYKSGYDLDAFSEIRYQYFKDGIRVDLSSIFKYRFDQPNNQYGSKDILLLSFREIAKEAKVNGYKYFYAFNNYKKFEDVESFAKFVNSFNPSKYGLVYDYTKGKDDKSSSLLGSLGKTVLAVGGLALATAGSATGNFKAIDAGMGAFNVGTKNRNNDDGDIYGEYTPGKDQIDNDSLFELGAYKIGKIYDGIDLICYFFDKDLKPNNTLKFNTDDVLSYFEEDNSFRIKELYDTKNHFIVRGVIAK